MPTSPNDKPFSEATIADVEAMLTRVFTKIAIDATLLAEVERCSSWNGENAVLTEDQVQSRYNHCKKLLPEDIA